MEEQRRNIKDDLSGSLDGEVRCDPTTLQIYSSDASIYAIEPIAVVYPKHAEDVETVARYAQENGIPIVPRGAGTGVAGSCLGHGLVVDFSRWMNQIKSVDEDTIRVQAGITRAQLNAALKPTGRYFAPDPANAHVTTIGGMLGVNSSGSRSVLIGTTRDHVQSIEMVTAGGHRFEAGIESLNFGARVPGLVAASPLSSGMTNTEQNREDQEAQNQQAKRTLLSKLAQILDDKSALIHTMQPSMLRNTCGYSLRKVLSETELNLKRVLIGSEGTLGMFTAATLHTTPLPEFRGIALILFGDINTALAAMQGVTPLQPSACDLLDKRLLSLARESDEKFEQLITPAAEAALLIESSGLNERDIRQRLKTMLRKLVDLKLHAKIAVETYDAEQVDFLWTLPSKVVPHLTRLGGTVKPLPFIEDVAVAPGVLAEFIPEAQKVFQRHEVIASLYTHAASGQVHFRPFLPPPNSANGQKMEAIARDLYQLVFRYQGTISGEHGDGLSRTAFIRSQYGDLYRVFQQVKALFDPHNLMNPGKIISDDPHLTTRHFRQTTPVLEQEVKLQLNWEPATVFEESSQCNGCGACRSTDPDLRMCPFHRLESVEEFSPRSKANLVRRLITRKSEPQDWCNEDVRQLTDSCFNCKQCQLECPSNVDIPHLVQELKASYVATNGLKQPDWILSRGHSFGALGGVLAFFMNGLIRSSVARWFLEQFIGISRHRKLAPFARRPFVKSLGRELQKKPPVQGAQKPVVYFVGDYANYHDPELAQAFVAILKHHDIPVHVPGGQAGSGMATISVGDLAAAKEIIETNVNELVELAREQHPIICTEPSAALALKYEYPKISDHPDVHTVSEQVIEAGAFLEQLHREGKLKTDFEPLDLTVGYHTPCHLKALGAGTPLLRLLSLIPELKIEKIEKGCSGMAGTFGLARDKFQLSLELGSGLIERMQQPDLNLGTTECTSCKMQMEQNATIPTMHPLKLMALSYGLMPSIRKKLTASPQKLVIS